MFDRDQINDYCVYVVYRCDSHLMPHIEFATDCMLYYIFLCTDVINTSL